MSVTVRCSVTSALTVPPARNGPKNWPTLRRKSIHCPRRNRQRGRARTACRCPYITSRNMQREELSRQFSVWNCWKYFCVCVVLDRACRRIDDLLTTMMKYHACNYMERERWSSKKLDRFTFKRQSCRKMENEKENTGSLILPMGGVRGQRWISNSGRKQTRRLCEVLMKRKWRVFRGYRKSFRFRSSG